MRTPAVKWGSGAIYSMVRSSPEERIGVWCCRVGLAENAVAHARLPDQVRRRRFPLNVSKMAQLWRR